MKHVGETSKANSRREHHPLQPHVQFILRKYKQPQSTFGMLSVIRHDLFPQKKSATALAAEGRA